MKKPNQGDYLSTGAAHTLEHLFATYARNSQYKDGVIYVGPMGCRTGFYLLTRGRFWGGSPGLQVQYFFSRPPGGRGLYWYRGKLPIRFDSFLFG